MRHTDTQHILLNQDGFCFPVGNGIEKPMKNVEGYEKAKYLQ